MSSSESDNCFGDQQIAYDNIVTAIKRNKCVTQAAHRWNSDTIEVD